MLSDGGDSAAAGATAQATANTKVDATNTADAQQCSDLVHTESGKEPAIWQKRRLSEAIENWHESEARERELVARERELVARNRTLEHALMQLVQATRAMATGLRPGQDISNLVGLANQLAERNLNEEADSDDEAGAASTGAASVGNSDDDGEFVHCGKKPRV